MEKLYEKFAHALADKLFKLLKNARPEERWKNSLKVLEDLIRRGDCCQWVQLAFARFQVSLGTEKIHINKTNFTLYISNIVQLSTSQMLQRILVQFIFSLTLVNAEIIWTSFVKGWDNVYTCLLSRNRADGGSCAWGNLYRIANGAHIDVSGSNEEAHSSFGTEEANGKPLHKAFRKTRL